MRLIEVKEDKLKEYSAWLKETDKGHVFQSVEWAFIKKGTWTPHFFMIEYGGKIIGSTTMHIRNIPVINKKMIYLPRGPVFLTYEDKAVWNEFKLAITKFAKEMGAILVKMDPAITVDKKTANILKELGFISLKKKTGFGGFEPAATIRFNLEGPEEDVFQRIPKKTRYNIRYPEKQGVIYQNTGPAGLDDYLKVMQDTSERAEFVIRTKEYYSKLFKTFGDDIMLTMGYLDGEPIAGGITIVHGDKAWAFSGGSSNSHRNLKAFHGLIWQRMLWAKEKGAKLFDFYGIPVNRDSENEDNKKVYGIYLFKKSFGGEEYDFIGEYDLPVNKAFYKMWQAMVKGPKFYGEDKKKT